MIPSAYAPTSSSICGTLFLPNSTRRVPPACRTRADFRPTDRLTNGEVPCRLTARASPLASYGPRLAGDGIKAEGDAGNERHICKANPATTDDIGKKHGMEDASEKFFRREICFGTESSYQIP